MSQVMNSKEGEKIESTDEAWDTGALGEDEAHVRVSTPERESAVDSATELQMISVRLHRQLIDQLKFIASHHGVGYQPLMRDVLSRWARTEMLTIAEQMKADLEIKAMLEASRKTA